MYNFGLRCSKRKICINGWWKGIVIIVNGGYYFKNKVIFGYFICRIKLFNWEDIFN